MTTCLKAKSSLCSISSERILCAFKWFVFCGQSWIWHLPPGYCDRTTELVWWAEEKNGSMPATRRRRKTKRRRSRGGWGVLLSLLSASFLMMSRGFSKLRLWLDGATQPPPLDCAEWGTLGNSNPFRLCPESILEACERQYAALAPAS